MPEGNFKLTDDDCLPCLSCLCFKVDGLIWPVSAFRMLYTFVQKQRNEKENDKLSVTYFVAGVSTDGNGNKVLW